MLEHGKMVGMMVLEIRNSKDPAGNGLSVVEEESLVEEVGWSLKQFLRITEGPVIDCMMVDGIGAARKF